MRKITSHIADHWDYWAASLALIILGSLLVANGCGCAGLGEDLTASLEEGAVAGIAAAAEPAAIGAVTELEGGDADWTAVGVGAGIAAGLAFVGGLVRRRLKRSAATAASATEG